MRPRVLSSLLQLPVSYVMWHYTLAWEDIFRLYRNGAWFLLNFFSIRLLSETLFSPWHRIQEHASKDTAGVLGSFIMNALLRFIGFFVRTGVIVSGLTALLIFSLFFLAFLALWPFLPFVIVVLLMIAISGIATF